MTDRYYYINLLEKRLGRRCGSILKTFFQTKFDWRFEFRFENSRRNWRPNRENSNWLALKEFCDSNAIEYKTRIEFSNIFFTKDLQAVEYIIKNDNLFKYLNKVEYTSDVYHNSFISKDEISTDVRLVGKVPEHSYLVILGQLGWKDNPIRRTLSQYLITNKNNFIFKGYYAITIERMLAATEQGSSPGPLYDGFQFYARDTDDIMMLHLVAPGKIVKVIKLIEKRKANES